MAVKVAVNSWLLKMASFYITPRVKAKFSMHYAGSDQPRIYLRAITLHGCQGVALWQYLGDDGERLAVVPNNAEPSAVACFT